MRVTVDSPKVKMMANTTRSAKCAATWQDPALRARMADVRRELWKTAEYREARDRTMRCVYCGAYRSRRVVLRKDEIGATVCADDASCEERAAKASVA